MRPAPPRPVGVSLIALFLGGTAVVALLLPLTIILPGLPRAFPVPFFGDLRALDDTPVLAVLAGRAVVLLVAAVGLWWMRRIGLWLALVSGWLGMAFHLVAHWPWWIIGAHPEEPLGGAWPLVALLLGVQNLLFLLLLVLGTVYLVRRRALFR